MTWHVLPYISGAHLVFAIPSSLSLYTKTQIWLVSEKGTRCYVYIRLGLFIFHVKMARKTKNGRCA